MSVEQRRIGQRGIEARFIRKQIKPLAFKEIPPVADKLIGMWTETHGLGAKLDFKEGFANAYLEAIKDGYFPVVIANHDSQSNAVSLIKLSYILTGSANEVLPQEKRIEGFLLPLAESLDSGRQGKFAKMAYDGAKPTLEKYGIIPVLTTTKNDENKREMKRKSEQFMKDMKNGVKEGYAIAVLAEGTVESGRRGTDGKRKGMQEFVDIALETPYILAKRYKNQKTIFIPVGIENGTEIHDPTGKLPLPHFKAFRAGFGFGDAEIGILHIGLPIKSDGPEIGTFIDNYDWANVNNTVGKAVASLIPEEMRGVYK